MTTLDVVRNISIAAFLFLLYNLLLPLWRSHRSPLRHLPGPPNPSIFRGQGKTIADELELQEEWIAEYGHTLSYQGFLGIRRLYTIDTRAVHHVLAHPEYQKPSIARKNLARLAGNGLLIAEGEQHRQQRKVMNPAFGPTQLRELTGIFVSKAIQLRDIWVNQVISTGFSSARVDVLADIGRATLDVIGLAGFNYDFGALNEDDGPNELKQAFETIFTPEDSLRLLPVIHSYFPLSQCIKDDRARKVARAQEVMRRIGLQLVAERKALIEAQDIPDCQRMSDEDVLAQVPTFLVAGHETITTGTMWCLFALTQNPRVQDKLRQELLAVPTQTPTMDELNALPYLDAFIRETMRYHPPVPSTIRIATQDDVIPVSTPYTDVHGEVQTTIRVAKGDMVFVPILSIHMNKELWGPDANEFKPERWEKIPEAVSAIPGTWSNTLSFLGGPRSCIGYRFALVEMKALIFTLVRTFEFELGVRPEDVVKKSNIVQRPLIAGELEKGTQMPLLLKLHKAV
ncbi:Cytochrome P450 superfamily protein [Abortiporus biennis]